MSQRRSRYPPLWVWDCSVRALGGGLITPQPLIHFGDSIFSKFFKNATYVLSSLAVLYSDKKVAELNFKRHLQEQAPSFFTYCEALEAHGGSDGMTIVEF